MNAKKILVVDDEREMVDFIKEYLESRKYEVIVAYNGEEALEKAKEKPGVMILDIMMPGMDGFEVLRRIKSDPETSSISVIVLTAKTETGNIYKSEELRATDYIIKPFILDKLKEKIDRYVI